MGAPAGMAPTIPATMTAGSIWRTANTLMQNGQGRMSKGVLDMHLVGFIFGHGNSPSLIIVRGGSTPCCRPLDCLSAKAGGAVNGGAYAPFILTVDWLGWLCYDNIVISSALIAKGTNQTDYVWFLHLRYRDLAYSQPDNPIKIPWIDMQISH